MVLATQIAPARTGPAASDATADGPLEPGHLPYNLMHNKLSWPAGTSIFSFRTWAALALGFLLAFILELEAGGGVGTSVLILVAPAQGMVLSKAIYRIAGTLVGAVATLLLTALFPQDRTMLIASFSVYMGLLVACGTLLRDFRAYGCILAGYTVANISIANIDAPDSVFLATVDRVAVIILGIISIAVVNALFAKTESARSLASKMRAASRDVIAMALYAVDQRTPPDPSQCVAMSLNAHRNGPTSAHQN
jgi:uncharacterized membrane protein YccC